MGSGAKRAINALKPGVAIPGVPMTVAARLDDSGTTENFADYLHATAPENWTHDPSGSWPAWLGSEQAQGNSAVVTTVSRKPGALTYADDSLVDMTLGEGKLRVDDSFVAVTASHRVPGRPENDIALELDRSTSKVDAYRLDLVKDFGHYVDGDEEQQFAAKAAKAIDSITRHP